MSDQGRSGVPEPVAVPVPVTPPAPAAEPPSTEFWVVRHGESTWNAAGRSQGQADVPLSAQGRLQAAILAERLTGQSFAGVYSSDLRRALDTARAVSSRLAGGPDIQTDAGLREIDVGLLGGLDSGEIARRFPDFLAELRADPWAARRPGGESMSDLARRVAATFALLGARHPGGRVLVFTHGGVVRVAVGLALGAAGSHGADGDEGAGGRVDGDGARGVAPAAWARLSVANTSVTRVLLSPQGGTLLGFNDAAHLETLLEATEADDVL